MQWEIQSHHIHIKEFSMIKVCFMEMMFQNTSASVHSTICIRKCWTLPVKLFGQNNSHAQRIPTKVAITVQFSINTYYPHVCGSLKPKQQTYHHHWLRTILPQPIVVLIQRWLWALSTNLVNNANINNSNDNNNRITIQLSQQQWQTMPEHIF